MMPVRLNRMLRSHEDRFNIHCHIGALPISGVVFDFYLGGIANFFLKTRQCKPMVQE